MATNQFRKRCVNAYVWIIINFGGERGERGGKSMFGTEREREKGEERKRKRRGGYRLTVRDQKEKWRKPEWAVELGVWITEWDLIDNSRNSIGCVMIRDRRIYEINIVAHTQSNFSFSCQITRQMESERNFGISEVFHRHRNTSNMRRARGRKRKSKANKNKFSRN